ncbi:hypothetical protein BDW22DRAFT_1359633 [Trametopsis cervina]|nr:hypothetical protein BDW22DRAFT_1359633 [Trametopsis cervina]
MRSSQLLTMSRYVLIIYTKLHRTEDFLGKAASSQPSLQTGRQQRHNSSDATGFFALSLVEARLTHHTALPAYTKRTTIQPPESLYAAPRASGQTSSTPARHPSPSSKRDGHRLHPGRTRNVQTHIRSSSRNTLWGDLVDTEPEELGADGVVGTESVRKRCCLRKTGKWAGLSRLRFVAHRFRSSKRDARIMSLLNNLDRMFSVACHCFSVNGLLSIVLRVRYENTPISDATLSRRVTHAPQQLPADSSTSSAHSHIRLAICYRVLHNVGAVAFG